MRTFMSKKNTNKRNSHSANSNRPDLFGMVMNGT